MAKYKGIIPILESGYRELNPAGVSYGCVPRDYSVQPQEMFASPDEMKLIPESEWDARFDEQEETQSSLEHLFLRGGKPAFVNLDQGQVGYCWAHSTTHAVMLQRLAMGLPFVPLSAYAVAATIKKGADEGGWCGLSAKFIREKGVPSQSVWPQGDRNYKKHDTPETWADAAKHKITDEWVDLSKSVYDQNLNRLQLATSSFKNQPGPRDYNGWGHSVCGVRWVRIEKGNWGQLILNSWKGWGYYGLAVLQGKMAISDGALAIRSVTIA